MDETKLSLAVSNLVENAIKYNHKNGWVHVSLNADHKIFLSESGGFRDGDTKGIPGAYF